MKNFLKTLTLLVVASTVTLGGFVPSTLAVAPLEVQFVPDPLFDKPNFLPLDVTTGIVTVSNNSGTTQNILTEAINVLDADNFGSLLHLTIVGSSGTLFDNSLSNFFTTAGELSLGSLLNGESKTFTYTISFINSYDNSYQGRTLGFDVCVGFEGGTTHCGDTVVGSDSENPTGGGGTISGSGGGSSAVQLVIFNEHALNMPSVDLSGSATITWDTNLLSTSHVVYGLASGGPYTLVLTPPNFGYPLATVEDSTKVVHHAMLLTGLTPGQTYLYRVVSRASPPTVSPEHQFTVPLVAQVDTDTTGAVLGASVGGAGDVAFGDEFNRVPGAVLGEATSTVPEATSTSTVIDGVSSLVDSGWGVIVSSCFWTALLVLLVLYLVWRLWLRRKYERAYIDEDEIRNRFYLYFSGSSLLLILVSVALGRYCPLPVFVTACIISVCLYAYRKLILMA